jgi:hypothetical protein
MSGAPSAKAKACRGEWPIDTTSYFTEDLQQRRAWKPAADEFIRGCKPELVRLLHLTAST